ncbi:hypothetical protein [Rhodococcoides corynebacterioides]|uniref:hypothetical protein n=1 Tax=Rhodococcoides corynebacterioides TaxID=53972 RepID=UPI0027E1D767|nr:hypothetical protein [Rhodococcus corynebacterioides]
MSVLLGVPSVPSAVADSGAAEFGRARRLRLEQDEREAMQVLADGGLIPRLRLVRGSGLGRRGGVGGNRSGGSEHAAG